MNSSHKVNGCLIYQQSCKRGNECNKNLIELACLVRIGEILTEFLFCKFMDLTFG